MNELESLGQALTVARRTALTRLHQQGVPLRIIQEISGHKSLATLQKYLEVTESEKENALGLLSW